MTARRMIAQYLGLVGAPMALFAAAMYAGLAIYTGPGHPRGIADDAAGTAPHPSLVFGQLAVVLLAAHLAGRLCRSFGQPRVVGEMAAGIVLGPSIFGVVAPGAFDALFGAADLRLLGAISEVGLVLFVFLVGLALDPVLLRGRGHAAVLASHTSITAPFALGVSLALWLYPRLAPPASPFPSFALFMGAAMSVTAFPVLARILIEQRLLGTPLGALAIACAAVDDVTAWAILGGVIVMIRAGHGPMSLWTVVGACALLVVLFGVVRRAFRGAAARSDPPAGPSVDVLAATALVAFVAATVTEYLGLHRVFGALLAGAAMPRNPAFVQALRERVEPVTVVVLLPVYFAVTGLRTSVSFALSYDVWAPWIAIMVVAIAGKFGGCTIAARVAGMDWRRAAALGTLMNTRGLMELVFLNIGLELGVISPQLHGMMVMMALVTTFMTVPLLRVILPTETGELAAVPAPARADPSAPVAAEP